MHICIAEDPFLLSWIVLKIKVPTRMENQTVSADISTAPNFSECRLIRERPLMSSDVGVLFKWAIISGIKVHSVFICGFGTVKWIAPKFLSLSIWPHIVMGVISLIGPLIWTAINNLSFSVGQHNNQYLIFILNLWCLAPSHSFSCLCAVDDRKYIPLLPLSLSDFSLISFLLFFSLPVSCSHTTA